MDCKIADCDSKVRWSLEWRGFTPTFAHSCKEHLSQSCQELMDEGYSPNGVVIVHKWGVW